MNVGLPVTSSRMRAREHVTSLAFGAPLGAGPCVTLNLHPDRAVAGRPILERLREDGLYVSQFVTGTSNGGSPRTPAATGGPGRAGSSEARTTAPGPAERPVYGALDVHRSPYGAAPRFGSAHVRLVADRRDALDDYIEAQLHAPVRLDRDVAALVLDPAYRGTAVEAAARLLPCPVEWHPGFRFSVEELRLPPATAGRSSSPSVRPWRSTGGWTPGSSAARCGPGGTTHRT